MATEEVLHMNGGVGDASYSNNSQLQKKAILTAKPILEESLKKMYCSNNFPRCLKVADLGCSSGPNTLEFVSEIMSIIVDAARLSNLKVEEERQSIQIFLNDLYGNDFNTIFRSIPHLYKRLEEDERSCKLIKNCFINATPGSFYGRLFPSNSIHFFHSSSSLHWLSQVPKGLRNNGGEALNKDSICVTSTDPPALVHKAYLEQFQQDLTLFLKLRAEELVPSGAMLLTFIARKDDNNSSQIISGWTVLGMVLQDMVSQNLIEKEKLEEFNIPLYNPTGNEVREVIEEEGSFRIERVEVESTEVDDKNDDFDDNMRSEFMVKHIRAASEPLLKSQFGEAVMDELYLRLKHKAIHLLKQPQKWEFPSLLIFSLTKMDIPIPRYK